MKNLNVILEILCNHPLDPICISRVYIHLCYCVKGSISLFSNFLYCNFLHYHEFSMDAFQVFSTHSSNGASAPACDAKSPKTLKTLQNQASPNHFRTLLQQLPQGYAFADSELLSPPPKRPCLLNRDLDPPFSLFSSSPWLQSSPPHRFLPPLKNLPPIPVVSPLLKKPRCLCKSSAILPSPFVKKRRRRPLFMLPKPPKPPPKKMGRSRKAITAPPNQKVEGLIIAKPANKFLLAHKTMQDIESTKHSKATESAKEKKLCIYAYRSRRHARECAQAL